VLLVAEDELALGRILADARDTGVRVAPFYEPDLDGALTALAIGPAGYRLTARLPLALAVPVTSSRREEVTT
jgi:hypothetical protein